MTARGRERLPVVSENNEVEPSDAAKSDNGELQPRGQSEADAGARARRHAHRLEDHDEGVPGPIDPQDTTPDPAP